MMALRSRWQSLILLTGNVSSNESFVSRCVGIACGDGPQASEMGVPGRVESWGFMLHLLLGDGKKASRHQQTQHLAELLAQARRELLPPLLRVARPRRW